MPPNLPIPPAIWNIPTMTVTIRANSTYRADPGVATSLSVANKTADIAVVGPDIIIMDEPNRAAIIAVIIAVYNPYSGGKPAIVAKATP